MDLKEELAEWLYYYQCNSKINWERLDSGNKELYTLRATELIIIFQTHLEEQLEGLKVMDDEQIVGLFDGEWDTKEDGLGLIGFVVDERDRKIAQAQLEYVKKQLRREK